MSNPNPKLSNLKPFTGRSDTRNGRKPKGSKHLSTWIQDFMEDETFKQKLSNGILVQGAPIKAIVATLIIKALEGDYKAIELLAKYGYGNKIDVTSNYQTVHPILGGVSKESLEVNSNFITNK